MKTKRSSELIVRPFFRRFHCLQLAIHTPQNPVSISWTLGCANTSRFCSHAARISAPRIRRKDAGLYIRKERLYLCLQGRGDVNGVDRLSRACSVRRPTMATIRRRIYHFNLTFNRHIADLPLHTPGRDSRTPDTEQASDARGAAYPGHI